MARALSALYNENPIGKGGEVYLSKIFHNMAGVFPKLANYLIKTKSLRVHCPVVVTMAVGPIGCTWKRVRLPVRKGDYGKGFLAGAHLPHPGFIFP